MPQVYSASQAMWNLDMDLQGRQIILCLKTNACDELFSVGLPSITQTPCCSSIDHA